MKPRQTAELSVLLHLFAPDSVLAEMASDAEMYSAPGPGGDSQAILALCAALELSPRTRSRSPMPGLDAALLSILRALSKTRSWDPFATRTLADSLKRRSLAALPQDVETWPEFVRLAGQLACCVRTDPLWGERAAEALTAWADRLERAISERAEPRSTRNPQRRSSE